MSKEDRQAHDIDVGVWGLIGEWRQLVIDRKSDCMKRVNQL